MVERAPRITLTELVLLVALLTWGLFPVVLLLIHAAALHARFTGSDGLIGADGVLGADQLQYLAWGRDAGAHGLASDLFSLTPSGHVYLEPVSALTGLLSRLGVSLQLAYLIWKPIAAIVMFIATVAWARRMFSDQSAARAATVAVSLFLYTPLMALFGWLHLGSGSFRFQLYLLAYELLDASKLWGYVPGAIALALVPIALLAVERAVEPGCCARRATITATLAALAASWLHPWQGITLVLIFSGLVVMQRLRRMWPVVIAAIGAALPLGYYYLLSTTDPAWKLASHYEVVPRLPALVLLAGLGPLAVIALLGIRRPRGVMIEQALLLWIGGCFVTYFVNSSFAPHALQGLSMPLAVLAVRGWQRLRLPALLSVGAIGLITLPGLAADARKFALVARSPIVQYFLPRSDARALDWVVAHDSREDGILAPTPFSLVILSQTGRAVWVGHGYWSQNYFSRAREANALFRGRMSPSRAVAFVKRTGAGLLVSDCHHRADLSHTLAALVTTVRTFGCARVYVLK